MPTLPGVPSSITNLACTTGKLTSPFINRRRELVKMESESWQGLCVRRVTFWFPCLCPIQSNYHLLTVTLDYKSTVLVTAAYISTRTCELAIQWIWFWLLGTWTHLRHITHDARKPKHWSQNRHSLLCNDSVNTFPRQQICKQQSSNFSCYASAL
jgi:hypothetical protein